MKLEISKDEYEILKEFFELHSIEVTINSVIIDEALVKLGFAKQIPCVIELDISKNEIDRIYEICNDYDIAACMSEDTTHLKWDPLLHKTIYKPTEEERLYKRYGGIYAYFMD